MSSAFSRIDTLCVFVYSYDASQGVYPMKRRYFRLEGESLAALNKLIEFDSVVSDFRTHELQVELAKHLGKEAPAQDLEAMQFRLSAEFTQAQIRGYQDKLGFASPPVQVHSYDDVLYRAYYKYPGIAMNPGTSKRFFGYANLLQNGQDGEARERVAIYTSHEDYKGDFFIPPGAVELTEEEFEAYDPLRETFEYYRTYDEGAPMPEDFDPASHKFVPSVEHLYNYTHAFLVTGERIKALNDYETGEHDWFMRYQTFRDEVMYPFVRQSIPYQFSRLLIYVQYAAETPIVELTMGQKEWDQTREYFAQDFVCGDPKAEADGTCKVLLEPRMDTVAGQGLKTQLDKVTPHPAKPEDFGFEQRSLLDGCAEFNRFTTGFPYMKIERYDGGETKLLVFRMPPHVKGIDPPEGCVALSVDDYRAISGNEEDLPTHVFRIGGGAYERLKDYDQKMVEYAAKDDAFKAALLSFFGVTESEVSEYRLLPYMPTDGKRILTVKIPSSHYEACREKIEECFRYRFLVPDIDPGEPYAELRLVPNLETEKGRQWQAALDEVPSEPVFTKEMDADFGFLKSKGYDLMKIDVLRGTEQRVILHNFPAYITQVEAPAGCSPLTREEYALVLSESMCLSSGGLPPPRPAHLEHLPLPKDLKSLESNRNFSDSRKRDGLPLHERTEFNWFKIRRSSPVT